MYVHYVCMYIHVLDDGDPDCFVFLSSYLAMDGMI